MLIERQMLGRMLAGHPRDLGHPAMVEPGLVVVQMEGMAMIVVTKVTAVGGPATLVVVGDPVVVALADHLGDLGVHLVEVVLGDPAGVLPEDHPLHQVMMTHHLLQVMMIQMIGMIGAVVVVLEMVVGVRLRLLHLLLLRLPQGAVVVVGEEEGEDDLLLVTLVAAD